jgi:phage terminase large subunit-like protein
MAANVNRDQYDLVKDGMAAFDRKQPMLIAITTNGFERHGLFDDQVEYSHKILDGTVDDDRLLPFLYELDEREEWTDERMWVKANPGLGTIKSTQFLRDKVEKAKQEPSSKPTIMVKDFNLPETKVSVWLSFDEAVNEEPLPETPPSGKLSDIGFRYGVAGIDASDTTDLSAAKILMMRQDDERIYELSMYWMPEDALKEDDGYRRERDDAPYRMWVERGLMRTVPGNIIPKSVFIDWFEEVKRELDVWVFSIGYDRWGFNDDDIRRFEQYVGKERSEVVRQGPMTFSSPMKEMHARFRANQIVDGHNPVNEWCRMNVKEKRDRNDNRTPVNAEGNAKHRIDGFMAELNGYIALQRHLDEYKEAM